MKKQITISIVLLFISITCFGQLKDIEKIISGDFIAMKENNVKTIKLKEKDSVLISIEVFNKENRLILNRNDSRFYDFINYSFDLNGNVKSIYDGKNTFSLNFDSNKVLQRIERNFHDENETIYQATYKIDSTNLRSFRNDFVSINKKTLETKKNSRKFVFCKKDSLLSYDEKLFEDRFERRYWNKTEVKGQVLKDTIIVDSISNGKSIIKKYINSRNKSLESISNGNRGDLESKIIKEEYGSKIFEEYFYDNGKLSKMKEYFYEPYFSSISDTISNGDILWEIRTFDFKTQKNKSIYPSKKNFKKRKGKIIDKQKGVSLYTCSIRGCGTKKHIFPEVIVYSPSIISTSKLMITIYRRIDNYVFGEKLRYYNYYTKDKLTKRYKKLSFSNNMHEFMKRGLDMLNLRHDYIVEIVTNDNQVYSIPLDDLYEKLNIKFDIFSYQNDIYFTSQL
ncbi:hypothetical protein [Aureivirga sp. CE67]|uniref:hypothetical protein n=1 Tax=Aureivirga sp. CE67 TaxID=1788983 RepID=UPI0018C976CA|nr:hypothetical protein [Aureivirga sp. CE67]